MRQTIDFNPMLQDCGFTVPPIHITQEDDGYTFEWIFKNARLGIVVDTKSNEHGWWAVTDGITASGPLELGEMT